MTLTRMWQTSSAGFARSKHTKSSCGCILTAKTLTTPDVMLVKEKMMNRDPLTYTYPRTWAEVISRHPCTGSEAVAVEVHRRPLIERFVSVATTVCTVALILACALAYFDVLVK